LAGQNSGLGTSGAAGGANSGEVSNALSGSSNQLQKPTLTPAPPPVNSGQGRGRGGGG
jgi:hypothetical protein